MGQTLEDKIRENGVMDQIRVILDHPDSDLAKLEAWDKAINKANKDYIRKTNAQFEKFLSWEAKEMIKMIGEYIQEKGYIDTEELVDYHKIILYALGTCEYKPEQ